jgi:hypothetical protein
MAGFEVTPEDGVHGVLPRLLAEHSLESLQGALVVVSARKYRLRR